MATDEEELQQRSHIKGQQKKFALDLRRRRGIWPWDEQIANVWNAYYAEADTIETLENVPEWREHTSRVKSAARALVDALDDLRRSIPVRQHGGMLNTFVMGVALADELAEVTGQAQASDSFFFVPTIPTDEDSDNEDDEDLRFTLIPNGPQYEPLLNGIQNGIQAKNCLETLAHGEYGIDSEWFPDSEPDTQRPDGVTPFNWGCYQSVEILQKDQERGHVYRDLISLLQWWGINDTEEPLDWQSGDLEEALKARVYRTRRKLG